MPEANEKSYKIEIKVSKSKGINDFYYIFLINNMVEKWLKIMKMKI
jgi:hypothetical protein